MLLLCDNQGAIALSKNDMFHARTKHIDIHFHFIRHAVEDRRIELKYCATDDMFADVLTKALVAVKHKHFTTSLGLVKA